ncbi:MAG: hypothetical protein GX802_08165 [Clostridiales bacterium]|nr:hypothetical protein [Clostridiales bacterium]
MTVPINAPDDSIMLYVDSGKPNPFHPRLTKSVVAFAIVKTVNRQDVR